MHVTSHSFPIDKAEFWLKRVSVNNQIVFVFLKKVQGLNSNWIQRFQNFGDALYLLVIEYFVCWGTGLMTHTWFYIVLYSLIYSTSKSNKIGHNITQKTAELLNNTNFATPHWSFNLKIVWASKHWIPKTSKNSHYWLAAPLNFSCDKSRQPNY